MSNFSDGRPTSHQRLTSDASVESSSNNHNLNGNNDALASTGSLLASLQQLLEGKEKQVNQAGTLGRRILQQHTELFGQIEQLRGLELDKSENADVGADARSRYRELLNLVHSWDEENNALSGAFGSKNDVNDALLDPSDFHPEPPSHGPSAPTASQSRRARNAAHRANDVEFATEIGNNLLREVRRLQSLLGERDKAIQDMKEEKDDLEKTVENMRAGLRTQEQNADKYKEVNWNLEVTLQELRAQLTDSQSLAQRSEAESKRLTKLLASSREAFDTAKSENERLSSALTELKAKHETDVAMHRRNMAQGQRERSDLQGALDALKAEQARQARRLGPRFGSPAGTPGGLGVAENGDGVTPGLRVEDEDDVFNASVNRRKMDNSALLPPDFFNNPDSVDSSPDPSPLKAFKAPSHPSNEIEALQQKLAHAQRQIGTLKGSLAREKEMRMSYRRSLTEAGLAGAVRLDGGEEDEEDGGDLEEETVVDEMGVVVKRPRTRATPARRGGGRGRGTASFAHSGRRGFPTPGNDSAPLSDMADNFPHTYLPDMPDIEFEEDDSALDALRAENDAERAASPPVPPSNRTSIDGMDPAFANVLRSTGSRDSFGHSQTGSPIFTRSVRGGRAGGVAGGTVGSRRRGGVGYQEARPASIVGAADVLAAEFGIGMDSVVEDAKEEEEREMVDTGCQTEGFVVVYDEQPATPTAQLPSPSPPPAIAITPTVETADASLQTDPEPQPHTVEVPVVVKADMALQTEPEVAPAVALPPSPSPRVDMGTSPEPQVVRTFSDSSIATESPDPILLSEMSVQTEVEQVREIAMRSATPPPVKETSEAQTQTTPKQDSFFASTDTPRASVNAGAAAIGTGYARLRYLSSASTATAVPRNSIYQITQHDEEDEEDARTEHPIDETDTETGTETDMDDYQDARSVAAPTPTATESINDFHSISTASFNTFATDGPDEEGENDETQSIRASMMQRSVSGRSRSSRASSMMDAAMLEPEDGHDETLRRPPVMYESQAVETEPVMEEQPKRQLSEMSVQTDDWQPEPVVPKGFGLYRVGSTGQKFQFISSPTAALATAASPQSPSLPPISPVLSSPGSTSAANTSARPMRYSSASLQNDTDRRRSIDSAVSSSGNEFGARQHTVSLGPATSPTVDKTRPPTIALPPPPRMPPPPGSMPPPSFIPEKRRPASSLGHRDMPPPRPSSPPPAELIQRATTPTFGSALGIPGRNFPTGTGSMRQHGASLPPMSTSIGGGRMSQPPSTNSFRSAANGASFGQASASNLAAAALLEGGRGQRGLRSASSLLSDQDDAASHRSSISSDFHPRNTTAGNVTLTPAMPSAAETPGRAANTSANSTDPAIIHAITQTMIGEFLYKYTRRTIGKGPGEKRHKRFFWVHPYTRTLYWSSADPGSTNVSEASAKSAYIESVRPVMDPNPMPPGLHQYSVIISTPQREMKITAPTKERHEIWLNALQYLLARPANNIMSPAGMNGFSAPPITPNRNLGQSQKQGLVSPLSARSKQSGMSSDSEWKITPRGRSTRSRSRVSIGQGGSMGKRSGTPAAEYLRWTSDGPASPGARSYSDYEYVGAGPEDDDDDLDFEFHDSIVNDQVGEAYEGLENVRACCDGRHTVGRSGPHDHAHHHHHHHHHQHPQQQQAPFLTQRGQQSLNAHPNAEHLHPSRPVSPAFSFRSRASSKSRNEGGTGSGMGNLFSRFGSRRSKGPVPGLSD